MKKSIFTLIFILLSISTIYSQTVTGRFVDSLNVPIAYTSIGIKDTYIGTVSNDKGVFSLDLSKANDNSQIIISNISYKVKEYSLKEFRQLIKTKKAIVLEENSQKLREVTVSSKKLKNRNLGNRNNSSLVQVGFSGNIVGNEVGARINIKDSPTYIDAFNFFIANSDFDSLFFRLNMYSIKDDLPYKNLLSENIYFSTYTKKGKVSVDLEKYNIVVEEDVIITIEYITDFSEGSYLYFSAGLFGSNLYQRHVSVSKWEQTGMRIGFNVDVRY